MAYFKFFLRMHFLGFFAFVGVIYQQTNLKTEYFRIYFKKNMYLCIYLIYKNMDLIIKDITESQEELFKKLALELNLVCKSDEEMEDEHLVRMMQSEPMVIATEEEIKEFRDYVNSL